MNSKGISHYLMPVIIVVLVAIGGTFALVMSHADPASPIGDALPEAEPVSELDLIDSKTSDLYDDYADSPDAQPAAAASNTTNSRSNVARPLVPKPPRDRKKAAKAVSISLSQLGKREVPFGSNCIPNNKYKNSCQAWCAYYLSWVWRKAGVKIGPTARTDWIRDWGASKGHTHLWGSGYTPRPGDAILFGPYHTAMVASVEDGRIRVIGGNWKGKVQFQRSLNGKTRDRPSAFAAKEQGQIIHITAYVSPE